MTQLIATPRAVVVEEVVTRWVQHDGGALDAVLPPFRPPVVDLDRGFTRSSRFVHPTWIAHGRLRASGRRRRRGIGIEITVTAWSDDVAEVNVRRSGRRLFGWSATREHRYFALAHRVADDVADTIVEGGMLTV